MYLKEEKKSLALGPCFERVFKLREGECTCQDLRIQSSGLWSSLFYRLTCFRTCVSSFLPLFLLVSQPSIAFHLRMAKLSAFCLFADEQTLSRALPGKMDRIHRLQITTLNQDSVPNERSIGNLFQTSSFLLLLTKRMVCLMIFVASFFNEAYAPS